MKVIDESTLRKKIIAGKIDVNRLKSTRRESRKVSSKKTIDDKLSQLAESVTELASSSEKNIRVTAIALQSTIDMIRNLHLEETKPVKVDISGIVKNNCSNVSEWSFDIERDQLGKIKQITATAKKV